ncbi:MAG TPA: hypothetical protein G4O11_01245 [Anaerolineae bacterium]|nr:hypothetical protein [Anaerolineae bacterium]
MTKESMNSAYQVAQELLKDRLKDASPETLRELEQIHAADVIVVRGVHDHIEDVFEHAGTPFTAVNPEDLARADLRPDQIVFINCPGKLTPGGLQKIRTFVEEGGFLFTTDWALKHVLEKAFPGFVEYNLRPTRDEVVRIEVLESEDPFLKSVLDKEDDPQWWLEGSSYPIRILDKEKVKVLTTSKEIEERYGEAPVFITFDYGQGKIYHMISHFYLQRTETRTARHAAPSMEYLKQKGISKDMMDKYQQMGTNELDTGSVESAYTSQIMITSVLLSKRKHDRRRKGKKDNGKKKENV